MTAYGRRQVVQGAGAVGLGLLAGCGRLPWQGQPPAKGHRIGFLSLGMGPDAPVTQAFVHGLREFGYTQGQNIVIEYRNAEGQHARLLELASELVRARVEVIVAAGGMEPALAVKNTTDTIPLVFTMSADPVRGGIVASLAAPGGNATGLTSMNTQLDVKRLELLRDSFPGVTRLAVLSNPGDPDAGSIVATMERAAHSLGVDLHIVEARAPADFDSAFEAAIQGGAGALAVQGAPLFLVYYLPLVELAAQSRLPMIMAWREASEAGGLMSYGTNLPLMFRRAAYYVDRILKGAKPADLPVEQPREFEFVINLRTAQALGLTIPQSVLL